jgi:hypothetical protein
MKEELKEKENLSWSKNTIREIIINEMDFLKKRIKKVHKLEACQK